MGGGSGPGCDIRRGDGLVLAKSAFSIKTFHTVPLCTSCYIIFSISVLLLAIVFKANHFIAILWTSKKEKKKMKLVVPHILVYFFFFFLNNTGLSLTSGNPDILCTKVSDIKADCFHAYISNIICFTSAYAQAS